MQCIQCGGEILYIRHVVKERIAGVRFEVEQPARRCSKCGEVYRAVDLLGLHELAIAAELARRGIRKGEAVRYMRRAIGLRASDFAELLDVTADTVGRWERDVRPIDPATFAVLGSLVHDHREGRRTMLAQLHAVRSPAARQKLVRVVAA